MLRRSRDYAVYDDKFSESKSLHKQEILQEKETLKKLYHRDEKRERKHGDKYYQKSESKKLKSRGIHYARDSKKGIFKGATPFVRSYNYSYSTTTFVKRQSNYEIRLERRRQQLQLKKEQEAKEELEVKKEQQERRSKGLVVHTREKIAVGQWKEQKSTSIDTSARTHLEAIRAMDLDTSRAKYIAKLLGLTKKAKSSVKSTQVPKSEKHSNQDSTATEDDAKEDKENEKKDEKEENGTEAVALVRAVLSHLHANELANIKEQLRKYPTLAVNTLVTEEVTLSSWMRSINFSKKKLLQGFTDVTLGSPHVILPFDAQGNAKSFLKVQKLDASELSHPIMPFAASDFTNKLGYGMPSIVPNRQMFRHIFDSFTNDFFHGVDLVGGIIGGGAVTACLQPLHAGHFQRYKEYTQFRRAIRRIPLPPHIVELIEDYAGVARDALDTFKKHLSKDRWQSYASHTSDIDIFITAKSLEEGEKILYKLYRNIKRRFKQLKQEFVVVRTTNTVTFCGEYPYRHIQLVITTLRNLEDFLLFCDLDCTSCAYDGREVYMSPRSVRAFNKRCNLVQPLHITFSTQRGRVMKYMQRGFSTMLFELCKHTPRCDVVLSEDAYTAYHNIVDQKRSIRNVVQGFDYQECRLPYGEHVDFEYITNDCESRGFLWGKKLKHVWLPGGEMGKGLPKELQAEREERINRRVADEMAPMAGMRWKWEDSLKSRESEALLPKCYMCKKRSIPSFQPDQTGLTLCMDCTKLNQEMMDQWDNLTGKIDDCVALVTGARIKIGYYIALRLLRSGATVIGVTRFPHDAASKYAREPDYERWKDKLHIYGVDLRHLPSVNEFIAHVLSNYKRLDMLINNAAQTKRRPRAYYYEVTKRERELMQGSEQKCLVKNFGDNPFLIEEAEPQKDSNGLAVANISESSPVVNVMAIGPVALDPSLPRSAALVQVPLHPMDAAVRDDVMFPPGKVDEHDEPLDTRESTSWNQRIDEISTVELVEVQVVNSTVPFMLISSLTPLMKVAVAESVHKRAFIVNVTAVEGNFTINKRSGGHPHTNMAKAALNMMTKSIAATYAYCNIYTTSVDTGWCTEMRHVPMDMRDAKGVPIVPVPLTDKDGAARVLYPIYVGLTKEEEPPHGVLFHDFKVNPWL